MPSAPPPIQIAPAVPDVLDLPPLAHPYRLPPIARWPVLYHTAARVRVQKLDGTRILRMPDHLVAVPADEAWRALETAYHTYQAGLDALAATLRTLGTYAQRLAAAGAAAPNPLCPTVIEIADPDGYYAPSLVLATAAPPLRRTLILRHPPQMWEAPESYGLRGQKDVFVCPDDSAWDAVHTAWAGAGAAALAWQAARTRQGTYAAAAARRPPVLVGQHALPW